MTDNEKCVEILDFQISTQIFESSAIKSYKLMYDIEPIKKAEG